MFSKEIIGFDGREQAHDALTLAATLAGPESELIVCCVHRLKVLSARAEPSAPRLDRAEAEACLEEARRLLGGSWEVRPRLVASASAALTLQTEADRQKADLLVLGSSRRGAVGRVLVGSVTEQALHGAPCPVAVAPVGYRHRDKDARLARIAVGYDPAAAAPEALDTGAALAGEVGGRLRVISEDGEVAEKLVEASRELDLLILGSRGLGPLRRLVLGSIGDAVVRAAACPVLIVPPSSAQAGAEGPSEPTPGGGESATRRA